MHLSKLIEQFDDEVKGVHEYAKCSEKADSPQDSSMYQRMAQAEMEHAQMLSEAIARMTQSSNELSSNEKEALLEDILNDVETMVEKSLAEARSCLEESR